MKTLKQLREEIRLEQEQIKENELKCLEKRIEDILRAILWRGPLVFTYSLFDDDEIKLFRTLNTPLNIKIHTIKHQKSSIWSRHKEDWVSFEFHYSIIEQPDCLSSAPATQDPAS